MQDLLPIVITSSRDYLTAELSEVGFLGARVTWSKGGHYANISTPNYYDNFETYTNVDCFSFAWEKNRTSMLDFTTALESWISDVN